MDALITIVHVVGFVGIFWCGWTVRKIWVESSPQAEPSLFDHVEGRIDERG